MYFVLFFFYVVFFLSLTQLLLWSTTLSICIIMHHVCNVLTRQKGPAPQVELASLAPTIG